MSVSNYVKVHVKVADPQIGNAEAAERYNATLASLAELESAKLFGNVGSFSWVFVFSGDLLPDATKSAVDGLLGLIATVLDGVDSRTSVSVFSPVTNADYPRVGAMEVAA